MHGEHKVIFPVNWPIHSIIQCVALTQIVAVAVSCFCWLYKSWLNPQAWTLAAASWPSFVAPFLFTPHFIFLGCLNTLSQVKSTVMQFKTVELYLLRRYFSHRHIRSLCAFPLTPSLSSAPPPPYQPTEAEVVGHGGGMATLFSHGHSDRKFNYKAKRRRYHDINTRDANAHRTDAQTEKKGCFSGTRIHLELSFYQTIMLSILLFIYLST